MKTIYTTLPIYKTLRDQCYQRGLANGSVLFAPVNCPKHRLPSFQWLDGDDGATTITSIEMINSEGVSLDITSYFVVLPYSYAIETDVYFMYNGDTLKYALPEGSHYLKITVDSGHIYYSDWFIVQCVYCPWAKDFVNFDFSTLNAEGTIINSAIGLSGAYFDSVQCQAVYKGQRLTFMFFLTDNGSVELPALTIRDAVTGNALSSAYNSVAGLNDINFEILSPSDNAILRISAPDNTNFSTSEMLVYTQYACGYVTISFSNCCTLNDIRYDNDFYQTLWIKSDNIEQQFPYVEKGQENGNGKFIPTFRRQEKTYLIRTGLIPQFLVDVLHRIKMHDAITYIDQVGDEFVIQNIDVEHEWQFDDKYYAMASITISLGEEIVAGGCCEIIT